MLWPSLKTLLNQISGAVSTASLVLVGWWGTLEQYAAYTTVHGALACSLPACIVMRLRAGAREETDFRMSFWEIPVLG